jgi:hypothetical protein
VRYDKLRVVDVSIVVEVKFVHDLGDFDLCAFGVPVEVLGVALDQLPVVELAVPVGVERLENVLQLLLLLVVVHVVSEVRQHRLLQFLLDLYT